MPIGQGIRKDSKDIEWQLGHQPPIAMTELYSQEEEDGNDDGDDCDNGDDDDNDDECDDDDDDDIHDWALFTGLVLNPSLVS